ncbi:MAG: type III secretion system translocon subunit SctE [Victivallales bacterium]|nr:type III secretion system translocon subunit SctE [Victivallales bacterium]
MPDTPGIREVNSFKPLFTNQVADFAKGLNINEKGQAVIKDLVSLLATDSSVRVMTNPTPAKGSTGAATGATNTPAIDSPDDPEAKEVDLEKLLMYLQLQNAEEQAKAAQTRIESQKDTLATQFKERLEKIKETMEKMDEAAKASLFSKIFGWLMAAVAVVVAVAACVATGGLAIGPVIGAVLAVGCMVLNETGAMDEIVKALAEGLEKLGMSKEAAEIMSQVIIAVAIIAASLACCGAGVVGAVGNTLEGAAQVAQNIQKGADIAMKVIAGLSVVANGVAAAKNYESGTAQADLSETNKILAQLQKALEDSQDELEKILEMIQGIYSDIVAILDSSTETQSTIAQQMSQMA